MFDDFETVKKYFDLNKSIEKLRRYRKKADYIFYSQTMATKVEFTEFGLQTRGFRVDKMAIEHILALEIIDKRIERLELRCRYFNRYLSELSQNDFNTLILKFKEGYSFELSEKLQTNILDEIDEIEIMVCLREGIEVPEKVPRVELSEDFDGNLTVLSSLFAI